MFFVITQVNEGNFDTIRENKTCNIYLENKHLIFYKVFIF